jgi:RND family efflux transporter MFP subunit
MSNIVKTLAVPLLALAALLLMILWLAGTFIDKIKPGTEPVVATYQGETYPISLTNSAVYEEVTAKVYADRSSEVSARLMARIQRIPVKSGDWVKSGDLLVELDSRDLVSRTAQAQGHLNSINARLLQAEMHFHRTQGLYQKDSATRVDLESATADYDSLKAQIDSARQALREAETGQSYSQILAMFPGRIIDRLAEPGDMAVPGAKLLALYDPASLRIEANIHEKLALKLSVGQSLEAYVDALQKPITIKIVEIVPSTDPNSRSLLIKAVIDDKANLLPGMFTRIRIPVRQAEQLSIPAQYVKQVGQLDVVWVLNGQIPERRFVRLGKWVNDNHVQVLSGLTNGEKLIDPEKTHLEK